jgi:ATP-dependent DNA helicase RecQ
VIKALNYLEEQGDLTLKVAGLRQGYRIKKSPADVSALKQKLLERFQTRERNNIDRVRQVVRLTQESGCIVRRLLEYFGEDLGRDCGHCGNCYSGFSGEGIQIGGESTAVKLDRGKIATLQKQNPKALGSIRQLTRFLCGLNSPSLTQAKLNKHGEFGSLAEVPFDLVMKAAETITRPEPMANRLGRERG